MRVSVIGQRNSYALDRVPVGLGGQAQVFQAKHKATGDVVAFKRVLAHDKESLARMRREIEVQSALRHPNIMPILEHGEDFSWYTMPFATQTLDKMDLPLPDDVLLDLIKQIGHGLAVAHEAGYIHRDISPRNILQINHTDSSHWVISDWGLVRRPRGMTTIVHTVAGTPFGTEGFAAPETWIDAHGVDKLADIYSVGRVVAWAVTGQWPTPNIDFLPDGRWRAFIRATTRHDKRARLPDMVAVLHLLEATINEPMETIHQQAEALLSAIEEAPGAAAALCELAIESQGDASMYVDYVSKLPTTAVQKLVIEAPELVRQLLDDIEPLFHDDDYWRYRNYDHANYPLRFVFQVAQCAADVRAVSKSASIG